MRKWLNNYFDFTKSEFNGMLVLIVLIALVTIAPYAYALVVKEDYSQEDYLIVKKLILKKEEEGTFPKDASLPYKESSKSKGSKKTVLFYFDPNLIGIGDWMRLGLSEKQAAAILKYVDKGGQFRQVEDLKKMYTISTEKYLQIYPFVRITKSIAVASKQQSETAILASKQISESAILPSTRKILNTSAISSAQIAKPYAASSSNATKYVKRPPVMVEVNAADSASLDEIRGIGPAFALRILNYRERIGGFQNKEQLMEVFGLDSLKFLEIKDQIRVDASSVKKININTATVETFRNHPYIRFKQINAIIQYRKQHGNYSNIADLAKVVVIPSETITRLAPYLTF
jgi:competence protein ComEA